MKQTPIKWLQKQLENGIVGNDTSFYDLCEQANIMFEQQIIESVDKTNEKWRSKSVEFIMTGKQYFDKTFTDEKE